MDQHDDLDRRLHDMLDDVPPHDDSARRAALEALPTTPQRRFRWLPAIAGGHRRARLSYASLAAGLIVVVAVGALGLNTIDRTPDRAAGQPDLTPPDRFHGTILCGPTESGPMITYSEVNLDDPGLRVAESRGGAYRLSIEAITDPRLDGELLNQLDSDRYGVGADAPEIGALTWTLQNDGGAWTTRFVSFKTDPLDWSSAALLWIGSGGYEGLSAVAQLDYLPTLRGDSCGWEMNGYVIDTTLISDFPRPQAQLPRY